MKYLFASVFTIIIILLFSFTNKEVKTVNDQNTELKNIQKGEYTVYLTHKKGDGNYMGGIADYNLAVTEVAPDKNFPNEHSEVMIEKTWRENNAKRAGIYLAGNLGFPATYIATGYEGNPKMQKEIGFAPSCYSDSYLSGKRISDTRVVFLDGRIYIIEDWKNKDDYNLIAVAEQGATPKGFKLMKAVMQTPKKIAALDPDKLLQEYLDAAFSEQQKHSAKHKTGEKKLNDIYNEIMKAIKDSNNEYWNSEEGQAIIARNKEDANSGGKKVTIDNDTGDDIFIYEEGSRNGSVIRVNSSNTFDCSKSYYVGSGSSVNGGGYRVVSANASCGATVTVN
jgi:hypothetical protein